MAPGPAKSRRRQFTLDAALLGALEAFARDSGVTLDALAGEALKDLMTKHGRPLSLKEALRNSARRELAANDREPKSSEPKPPRKRSTRKA